jgi:hypothetical protein
MTGNTAPTFLGCLEELSNEAGSPTFEQPPTFSSDCGAVSRHEPQLRALLHHCSTRSGGGGHLYADLAPRRTIRPGQVIDCVGHYARPRSWAGAHHRGGKRSSHQPRGSAYSARGLPPALLRAN